MASRASQSDLLERRIAENAAAQQIDLIAWIFDRIELRPEDRVLELCCGTGSQTMKFLELLGESGHVTALDISKDALMSLESKAGPVSRGRLTLVEGDLDIISQALTRPGLESRFDLVFCAYGLYYSANPRQTMDEVHSRLNPGGRIVVIGPYGANNRALFDMISASGVRIPDAVTASSERFMLEIVLPWAVQNFEVTSIHTLVNPVIWRDPERVLHYWRNTTFYDAEKLAAFEDRLHRHFQQQGEFVNEKWVMMLEMKDARN